MAKLTVQKQSLDGLNPTLAAADAAGDTFPNDGKTYFEVKNGSAGAVTITANSVQACNFGFDHDVAVSIAAGGAVRLGPFPTNRFNDTNGEVSVTYSAATSVTVAAVTLG
jgi:hypothetical protein